jgi:vacuolar-type H+-ATPase subunit F/Vma7
VSRVAAIGEERRVRGFALAGVSVMAAADATAARHAWEALEADIGLVILTPAAVQGLRRELTSAPGRLWVELPS